MPTSISLTILMGIVVYLAYTSDKKVIEVHTITGTYKRERVFVFLIILSLSLYAALRTRGNDTTGYIKHFIEPIYFGIGDFFSNGGWVDSKGPLFTLFLTACKYHLSDNYHIFFFIIALITNGSIVIFLRRYSCNFPIAIFLYLAMDGYGVSLTGMRQALATAIVIWTIPAATKKKWISFAIMLFLAYQIHFISILFLVVPFLRKKIWNYSVVILTILSIIAAFYFEGFSDLMLDASSSLGFTYQNSAILGTGVNILRVMVYLVPGVMALVYKNRLLETEEIDKICINSSVAGGALVGIGLNGNANTFGRIGLLFEPCIYIALPSIIEKVFDNDTKRTVYITMVILFLIYYLFGLLKNGFWTDYYGLTSVFDAFLT